MRKKQAPEQHNDFEDAFIREIDEELKNEKLKRIWDKYGLLIIILVTLAVFAAVSFETFKAWQDRRNQEMSNTFAYALNLQNQGRFAEADEVLASLVNADRGIYSDIAAMQKVNLLLEQNQTDKAVSALQEICNNDDFNPHTARLGEHTVTGATVYWDPSTGRKNADGSVCILLYRDDKTKNLFIHDVAYLVVPDDEVHPLARQCEMVLCFMQRHGIYRICVETNGLGNALPEIMRDVCARRNVTVTIQKIINHQRKETRILDAIEPVLTAGRLHAHVRIQSTPLIAEMLGWTPVGTIGHDDGLDALAGAICAQPIPVRPLGRSAQIFSANTDFKI